MSNIIKKILIPILFISVSNISAQFSNEHIGAGLGIGSIKGNSPSQSALAGNISYGFNHTFLHEIGIKFNYLYARKVNYFLPENRKGRYYPYIQSLSALATIEQKLNGLFFSEEGLGLSSVNDRTFSDVNEWDYGVVFSVMLGWDFRDRFKEGIKFAFNAESSITFTSTTASYVVLGVQVLYYY